MRSSSLRALVFVTPFVVLAVCPACDSGERREAEQLVAAVDRYRRADNPGKPAAVDALRAVPCSAPDVCRARDACLASADATARALRLKSEVEQGLAAIERDAMPKDTPEAQALPAKLDEAEALLKEGFERLGPCDEQLMALKRRLRI